MSSTSHQEILILHVDDEPDFADLARTFLEREDDRFTVETATSADEGLERINARQPDCVVSDYNMPGMDGLEFLEAVREDNPDLPFILYTGKGSEAVASEAIAGDVTDYLQKGSGSEQYELLANRIESAVAQSRAEQQAATTQRRLRELSEATDDILWSVTADWSEFLFVNSAYEDVVGRSRGVLRNEPMDFLQGVHPADRDLVTQKMQQASNGEPANCEFRVNADEDFQRRVYVQAEPIHDETGEPVRIVGFIRDITDQAERKLTLTRMEYIVQNMDDGAVIVQDGVIKYANSRLSELLGYAEDELVEASVGDFIAPEYRETVEKRHQARIAGNDADPPDQYELKLLSDDGQQIPVEINVGQIEYQDEPATLSLVRDITKRTHREERFQAFIENSTDIITVLNPDGTYQYQSPSSKRLTGYEPDELIDQTAFEYIHPEDRDRVIETFSKAVNDPERTPTIQYRFKHKDGSYIWLETVGTNRFENPAIEGLGLLCNSRDITDRKQKEQQLQRQNERLERFASVVSHDLRNPLNVAQGRLELVKKEGSSDNLDAIERSLARMEQLIDDVLTLAREGGQVQETKLVALAPVAKQSWQTVATDEALLVTETECKFHADQSRLQRLFENLFRNAVEHGGDDVTVTISDLEEETGFAVADDGTGIPKDKRDQIFDPGFSTAKEGSGFGLAIIREIAQAHGWECSVSESEDGGVRTEFLIQE